MIIPSLNYDVDGNLVPIQIEVGCTIRLVRMARGLTQKQLARLCGWDRLRILKYEGAYKQPGIRNLTKICAALDITLYGMVQIAEAISVRSPSPSPPSSHP